MKTFIRICAILNIMIGLTLIYYKLFILGTLATINGIAVYKHYRRKKLPTSCKLDDNPESTLSEPELEKKHFHVKRNGKYVYYIDYMFAHKMYYLNDLNDLEPYEDSEIDKYKFQDIPCYLVENENGYDVVVELNDKEIIGSVSKDKLTQDIYLNNKFMLSTYGGKAYEVIGHSPGRLRLGKELFNDYEMSVWYMG